MGNVTNGIAWTDAERRLLADRWKAGDAARQIAAALPGRTRNSVIGKANALKLKRRASPLNPRPLSGKPLPSSLAAFGEVGLGGELRPIGGSDRRKAEAKRQGFKEIISPPETTHLKDILKKLS